MVDPLDNLIGFYTVVSTKFPLAEGGQHVTSNVASSSNTRASGVTSALCVRSSELTKNTVNKKGVGKKISAH